MADENDGSLEPPQGMKRISQMWWDPDTEQIVMIFKE